MKRNFDCGELKRSCFSVLLVWTFFVAASAVAVPPHPSLQEGVPTIGGEHPYFLQNLAEMYSKGICSPEDAFGRSGDCGKDCKESFAQAGPFRVLALLVQFSDHPSSVQPAFFDSLLFSTSGNTVRDYYDEVSYGQIDLVTVHAPSSIGWRTAPQTYAYYVNGQNGTGAYPQNSQKLVEDLCDLVDPSVDFSQYDNDNNGYVDVLLVIHTGTGAELSGSNNDIWSHKWGISPRLKDGVYISSFTVQPEFWQNPGDMTIGVYAHELAHGFGLPDLYDVDYTSNGVGKWCLMAYGTWNGSTGLGNSPAHPNAWCKTEMGFITPTNVTNNMLAESISAASSFADVYRLWNAGAGGSEYFLVENRQKSGYDTFLPQSGLLIWHIDEAKSANNQEWYPGQNNSLHYLVGLEQADGLWEMEKKLDQGDAGDPFPGSFNQTSFNAVTTPNSNSYTQGNSFVAVENISSPGATMTADLIVGLSAGTDDDGSDPLLPDVIVLSQNYPNPFNPATTIRFTTTRSVNTVLDVYNVSGQKIARLFEGVSAPGENSVVWDATDQSGTPVASGVYFCHLATAEGERTRSMILVR